MANGGNKTRKGATDSDGFSLVDIKIKPNEWRHPTRNCHNVDKHEAGHYVGCNKEKCNICNLRMPDKPLRYKDSQHGKNAVASRNGGAASGEEEGKTTTVISP